MWPFNKKVESVVIRDVTFQSSGKWIQSVGLKPYWGKEMRIEAHKLSVTQLHPILEYMVEYIIDEELPAKHGDTISCFSWMIRLYEKAEYFEVFEYYPKESSFAAGLQLTYKILSEQISICEKLNVEPNFPLCDQFVSIDPRVKLGKIGHMFRWKKQDPESGWVVITSDFKADTDSFEKIPLGEFLDIAPYNRQFTALPVGYKVIWDKNDAKIGFDERMTKEE